MRLVVLVALCACNRLLGLDDVRDRTAPIDAPFACPPIGTTPVFSPIVRQALTQDCQEYARFSTGITVGTCRSDPALYGYVPSQGSGGDPLTPIPLFDVPQSIDYVVQPRIALDGSLALIVHVKGALGVVEQYRLDGGAWSYARDTPITTAPTVALGYFAAVPGGWRIAVVAGFVLEEWGYATATDTWSLVATHSSLNVMLPTVASLTEDGLRMLLVGGKSEPGVYFTDRPDLGSEFRTADLLPNVPVSNVPYLDQRCARLYVTGLQSVFYAQPQ